jgi:hypothetical protein
VPHHFTLSRSSPQKDPRYTTREKARTPSQQLHGFSVGLHPRRKLKNDGRRLSRRPISAVRLKPYVPVFGRGDLWRVRLVALTRCPGSFGVSRWVYPLFTVRVGELMAGRGGRRAAVPAAMPARPLRRAAKGA